MLCTLNFVLFLGNLHQSLDAFCSVVPPMYIVLTLDKVGSVVSLFHVVLQLFFTALDAVVKSFHKYK